MKKEDQAAVCEPIGGGDAGSADRTSCLPERTSMVFNVVRSTLLAVLYFLPYMIDRLLTPRFAANGFLSTLIFPAAVTGLFFLSSLEGPFDGTVAKTIYGYGPLMFQQLNSIVGLWGFIFLYSWLASILNHGGVGTLLMCHLAGYPIARIHDQASDGGNYFSFDRMHRRLLHPWRPIEDAPAA